MQLMISFFAYPNTNKASSASLCSDSIEELFSIGISLSDLDVIFSFNSIIIRLAVFAPIPGMEVKASTSPDLILFFSSVADVDDKNWIAVLGPTPDTLINSLNTFLSSS